jgi:hypothetical protein
MTTIEGQALRSEDNGPLACSGLQTELVERTPEEHASAEPSTRHLHSPGKKRRPAVASPGRNG